MLQRVYPQFRKYPVRPSSYAWCQSRTSRSQFCSSTEGRQIACLLAGLALFEIRDQGAQLRVAGVEGEQLAGVPECGGKVPAVARDRDERHQDVAIRRMLLVCLFQGGRRL